MVQRITCSADSISSLTNPQIRYIIDQVNLKTVNNVNDQKDSENSERVPKGSSLRKIVNNVNDQKPPKNKASVPSMPTRLANMTSTDFKPITYETKPDPELIIKSVLEHFTFLQLRNSFRGYDNYRYTKQMPCYACSGNHSNYGISDEWY